MSQNDFTIANQTFPNTRADINSALQALASTSSGSSAPSTTFANQFFYNTSSNLLQIRNEDNDAFITIAELDQTNDTVEYFKADAIRLLKVEYLDGDDAIIVNDGGGIVCPGGVDLTATELILDGDNDTTIHANTDDQIDFKIGGTDKVVMTGSVITMVGTTTNTMSLEVGTGRSGDGTSLIDLVGDATYGDFGARLIRNAGANSATELVHRGTGQLAIVAFDAAPVTFKVSNAEKMRVHSNGNVGIGTASPTAKLDVAGSMLVDAYNNGGAGNGIFLRGGFLNTQQPSITVATHNADSAPDGLSVNGNDGVSFRTANAERGRFTESGALFVGKTSGGVGTQGFEASGTTFRYTAPAGNYLEMNKISGTGTMINFMIGASAKGSISIDANRVYFNQTSDYRLKENVSYTFNATTRLKQLKPCRFSWISDSDSTLQDGFLAHEAKSVIPECVLGEKDATRTAEKVIKKADGTMLEENITEQEWKAGKLAGDYPNDSTWVDKLDVPDYQGIDQSKLVPLLVKTIQELEARITALEG